MGRLLVGIAFVTVGILAHACGGASTAPPTVASPALAAPIASAAVTPSTTPAKARGSCDDGSCVRCGEAVCYRGFFCAVNAKSYGCSWLPRCATTPTCACVDDALRDPKCTCAEKDGGVFVTCDGATLDAFSRRIESSQ